MLQHLLQQEVQQNSARDNGSYNLPRFAAMGGLLAARQEWKITIWYLPSPAELAGKIEGAQADLRRLLIDLDNVDYTMRLFVLRSTWRK